MCIKASHTYQHQGQSGWCYLSEAETQWPQVLDISQAAVSVHHLQHSHQRLMMLTISKHYKMCKCIQVTAIWANTWIKYKKGSITHTSGVLAVYIENFWAQKCFAGRSVVNKLLFKWPDVSFSDISATAFLSPGFWSPTPLCLLPVLLEVSHLKVWLAVSNPVMA